MTHKHILKCVNLCLLSVVGILFFLSLVFFYFTGSFFPIIITEELKNPVVVREWDNKGILLCNNKLVDIKEMKNLPTNSIIFSEALKNGIEINEDGTVFGLLKIHHWCRNDPVIKHIAKVNIRKLALFLSLKTKDPNAIIIKQDLFLRFGWDMSEYGLYEYIDEYELYKMEQQFFPKE